MRNRTLTAGVVGLALFGGQAVAQIAQPLKEDAPTQRGGPSNNATIQPPRPGELKPVSPLLQYGVLALIAGAIIGLSIMPSKRTHQD